MADINEGYKRLASAIILQAVEDYTEAIEEIKKFEKGGKRLIEMYEAVNELSPFMTHGIYRRTIGKIKFRCGKWQDALDEINEDESFFLSDSFDILCQSEMDGLRVINKLREREGIKRRDE